MSILVQKSSEVIPQGMTGHVERIVEIELKEEAKANFQTSVDAVKELLVACKGIDGSLA